MLEENRWHRDVHHMIPRAHLGSGYSSCTGATVMAPKVVRILYREHFLGTPDENQLHYDMRSGILRVHRWVGGWGGGGQVTAQRLMRLPYGVHLPDEFRRRLFPRRITHPHGECEGPGTKTGEGGGKTVGTWRAGLQSPMTTGPPDPPWVGSKEGPG